MPQLYYPVPVFKEKLIQFVNFSRKGLLGIAIMQKKRQAKLGFIHIPKTAGSTINNNLGTLLCPERIHIRALYRSHSPQFITSKEKRNIRVQFDSNLHREIKERDWVAGHISALAMAEFEREFTFSVFRDRKIRALSQYRFMRWRWDTFNKTTKEQIGIPPNVSFSDWLVRSTASTNKTRYGHNLIVGHKFKRDINKSETDLSNDLDSSHEVLLQRLGKVDRVYFPRELQEVMDNLNDEGLVPPIRLDQSSRITQETIYKKSEPEIILELLNSKSKSITLETEIFKAAKAKFPQYWTNQEIDDSEFLSLCEKYRVI